MPFMTAVPWSAEMIIYPWQWQPTLRYQSFCYWLALALAISAVLDLLTTNLRQHRTNYRQPNAVQNARWASGWREDGPSRCHLCGCYPCSVCRQWGGWSQGAWSATCLICCCWFHRHGTLQTSCVSCCLRLTGRRERVLESIWGILLQSTHQGVETLCVSILRHWH